MNDILGIAGSALQAFSVSQQVTAHNVANLNTNAFKSSAATLQENASGGLNATVTLTEDPVDISREAVNLISNSAGFKANINVMKAADEMMKNLFSIKA